MGDEYFGPALPPATKSSGENRDESSDDDNSTKKLPKKRKHSQSSSSGTSDSSSDSSSACSDESEETVCKHPKSSSTKSAAVERFPTLDNAAGNFIGPVMPLGFMKSKDEDDDLPDVGPKPPEDGCNELDSTVAEIEQRAQRMRNKLLNLDADASSAEKPVRETWMMELPPEHGKNFGLTARKFSMAAPSDNKDRSSWTDTPADRARKEQDFLAGKLPSQKISRETNLLAQRDMAYTEQVEEYNKAKKRDKSLLELHNEKKTKGSKKKKKEKKHDKEKHRDKKKKKKDKEKDKDEKKKKKKEKVPERRPFDRDMDLKVHRLDAAQKEAIIKRSQQLSSRFGHGSKSSKFL